MVNMLVNLYDVNFKRQIAKDIRKISYKEVLTYFENTHLEKIVKKAKALKHFLGVKVITYHDYGDSKNLKLGNSKIGNEKYLLGQEEIQGEKDFFISKGTTIIDF